MVPVERIELPTFGLQNRCTTAVLHRPRTVGSSAVGRLQPERRRRCRCASKRRRVPSPLRGGPTRPERPSGVGGAGVEHGGGKPGIVGAPRTCRTSEFDPPPPTPTPTPPRKGEGKARRRARSL